MDCAMQVALSLSPPKTYQEKLPLTAQLATVLKQV